MTIEVRLHGANGTRTHPVTPTGFSTRHINRATVTPSDPVKVTPHLPNPVIAPVSTPEAKPVSENPLGDKLNALITEVDDLLNPPARLNTEAIAGHHYIETSKRKANYDSPAIAYWDRVMQRKSDAEMAYRRKRAEAVA